MSKVFLETLSVTGLSLSAGDRDAAVLLSMNYGHRIWTGCGCPGEDGPEETGSCKGWSSPFPEPPNGGGFRGSVSSTGVSTWTVAQGKELSKSSRSQRDF